MYYFLRSNGDDSADGMSEATAWKTLDRLSRFRPGPGDTIRLRGGDTFIGSLDWGDWEVNGFSGRIQVTSYGEEKAIIRPLPGQFGINYSGVGWMEFSNLHLIGEARTSPEMGGIVITPSNGGCSDITLANITATGFGGGGVHIQGGGEPGDVVRRVSIRDCLLHDNTNGLWLNAVRDVNVSRVHCHHNDWIGGPAGDRVHGGSGAVISGERVQVHDSEFSYNGLRTVNAGGHTGVSVVGGSYVQLLRCVARGNGDPGKMPDGQGFVLYGCTDSALVECAAIDNINGLSLFEDSFTGPVERCNILRCVSTGNQSDLSLRGIIRDSTITGNQLLSTIYKAMDVASSEPITRRANVRVFGNLFSVAGLDNQLLLEAAHGLAGVELLEANRWEGPAGSNLFSVRGRGYPSIREALAATPLEV